VAWNLRARMKEQDRRCRVALLVNTTDGCYKMPREAPADVLAEIDAAACVAAYIEGIQQAGCDVTAHEGAPDLRVMDWLRDTRPDICFNVCEGFGGESREAHMPALLELLGLPYSGPTPLAAAVTQDKPTAKRLLASTGLPTPSFQVFETGVAVCDCRLPFPLFVKPRYEGTGMGISNKSLVTNREELREQVAEVVRQYRQPALVESYIEGRELTCGVIGNNGDLRVLPILEVDFRGYPSALLPVYSSIHKNDLGHLFRYECPAALPHKTAEEIRRLTLACFELTGCRDFARVDFRLTPAGQPFILEINALPGITPRSDMAAMAKAEGKTHGELVASVLRAALRRYRLR
jgi:D-alanine-D-alanine ligase